MYLQEMPGLCVCGNSRTGRRVNMAPTKLQSLLPSAPSPSAQAGKAPNERRVREREKGGGSWRVSEWRRLKGWKREKNGRGPGGGGGGVTAED